MQRDNLTVARHRFGDRYTYPKAGVVKQKPVQHVATDITMHFQFRNWQYCQITARVLSSDDQRF